MRFLEELESLLKSDDHFVAEDGRVLKAVVSDACNDCDERLLTMLLRNQTMKEHFFTQVDGMQVFNQNRFLWVINSREFLPDSYTAFRNKIGLEDLNGQLIGQKRDVTLVWPYKDCVLEGGQTKEDQQRDEIFYNETLAPDEITRMLEPKVLANAKIIASEEMKNIDDFTGSENLVIKGNNLLVLSSLCKRFQEKIRCIYIDPPYYFNSNKEGDTFKYNSRFKLSTWLTFMKNRLELAKKLLCPGGTIWISISDEGMHYLKVMSDEVFGRDAFVATFPRRTRSGKSDVPFNVSQDFDWLLVYTNVDEKNAVVGRDVKRKYYSTPDYPGQPWRLADLTSQRTSRERSNSYFTMKDPKTGKEYPANEKRTWALTKDTFSYYYDQGG